MSTQTIGVLALQGDFAEHVYRIERAGHRAHEIRTKSDLKDLDRLILPGGESTTMAKLLVSSGLDAALKEVAQQGMPMWGTCAGAILMAKSVKGGTPLETHLELLDMTLERNSYGRQTESFTASFKLEKHSFEALFIRAPRILELGRWEKVLLEHKGGSGHGTAKEAVGHHLSF